MKRSPSSPRSFAPSTTIASYGNCLTWVSRFSFIISSCSEKVTCSRIPPFNCSCLIFAIFLGPAMSSTTSGCMCGCVCTCDEPGRNCRCAGTCEGLMASVMPLCPSSRERYIATMDANASVDGFGGTIRAMLDALRMIVDACCISCNDIFKVNHIMLTCIAQKENCGNVDKYELPCIYADF